jgi:four helix bundle protein
MAIQTAKHIGGQIMRSGTSPALNFGEARGGESKADFIHKMKICLKELRETHVALRIIQKQNWFPEPRLSPILDECNQLIAIFVVSVKKAETNK